MKVYLKSNQNIKTISYKILLSLIPLILAGFYKNGIKLYNHNLVGIYGLLKPFIYTISGFIIGALVNIIYNYIKKNKFSNITDNIFSTFHPIYGIIIASVISINTNIILYLGITFIMLLISNFINETKFNIIAGTALIIILIYNIFGEFSFLNIYEKQTVLKLDTLDYLLGRGSGGINTTYVILLLLSFMFLAKEYFYKKNISVYSTITFSLLITLYCIFTNQVGHILDNIFTGGVLFSFIFIAPLTSASSYTNKGQIIFGILTGLITFLLYLIEPSLSALGAILIVSIIHRFIDNLCQKKPK